MSSRPASWLAWSLAALCVAMFVTGVVLFVLARSANVPSSSGSNLTLIELLITVPFLAVLLVGALIASRRPENPIGWICLADGFAWSLVILIDYYSVYGVVRPGSVPWPAGMAALGNWLWVPGVGLVGTYLLLLFPDGKLPSTRWRPLAWLSGVVIVLLSIGVMLSPEALQTLEGVRNPFGLEGTPPWVRDAGYIVLAMLPLCILASAASLVLRYRRSGGEVRQQIKWIAFAASVVGLVYLVAMVSSVVFPSRVPWFAADSPLWLDLLDFAALLSFTTVPIAVGLAFLRYRLYDIDLLINRALICGSLAATLASIYVGCVVSLQYAFRELTGETSRLFIVASTLAIAALFNSLRRHIQAFMDRRFYRKKYGARRTLETFGARLREETDLDRLGEQLRSAVRETVQSEHVSLWLRRPGGSP